MMEGQIRILVADDEEINRKLLGRLLERHGFYQKSVESGRAALAQWRTGQWDLVILDVNMPDMGGMDAARAIRAEEAQGGRASRVPVFALTAAVDGDEREACLASGMDAILTKPLRVETLLELVQAVFGGRDYSLDELIRAEHDDAAFAHELVQAYIRNEPAYLSALLEAAARRDAVGLKKAAHKLRGALCIIRADTRLLDIVRRLEDCGASGNLENLSDITARARMALAAFGARVRQLSGGSSPSGG